MHIAAGISSGSSSAECVMPCSGNFAKYSQINGYTVIRESYRAGIQRDIFTIIVKYANRQLDIALSMANGQNASG